MNHIVTEEEYERVKYLQTIGLRQWQVREAMARSREIISRIYKAETYNDYTGGEIITGAYQLKYEEVLEPRSPDNQRSRNFWLARVGNTAHAFVVFSKNYISALVVGWLYE